MCIMYIMYVKKKKISFKLLRLLDLLLPVVSAVILTDIIDKNY